jgi:hypothetical protein
MTARRERTRRRRKPVAVVTSTIPITSPNFQQELCKATVKVGL